MQFHLEFVAQVFEAETEVYINQSFWVLNTSAFFLKIVHFGSLFGIGVCMKLAVHMLNILQEFESPENEFSRLNYDFSKLRSAFSKSVFWVLEPVLLLLQNCTFSHLGWLLEVCFFIKVVADILRDNL